MNCLEDLIFMPIFAWTIKSLFWYCSLFDLKIVFEKSMTVINIFEFVVSFG